MGQRTQILLQTVSLDGVVRNKLYHEQWGFGKTMPMLLMNLITEIDYGKKSRNSAKVLQSIHDIELNSWNVSEEWEDKTFATDQINLNDMATVQEVLDGHDNNNGFMVVQLYEVQDGIKYFGEYRAIVKFLKGYEEVPSSVWIKGYEEMDKYCFGQYISFEKYVRQWKNYCPKGFIPMYKKFCELFGVEINVKVPFVEPKVTNNIETSTNNAVNTISNTAVV